MIRMTTFFFTNVTRGEQPMQMRKSKQGTDEYTTT